MTTTDPHAALEAQVADIRLQIRQASDARARAAHQRELAEAALLQTVEAIKAEFGVATIEEAQVLLTKIAASLAAEAAHVAELLKAAGQ